MTEVQRWKREAIRPFVRRHYTDEVLAAAIAHAEDGKLAYESCCCLVGIPTADHALDSYALHDPDYFTIYGDHTTYGGHYSKSKRELAGAVEAERAWFRWTNKIHSEPVFPAPYHPEYNSTARRILLPVLRAEQWRRSRMRQNTPEAREEVTV